ncbi:hypothetical protein SCACP_02930 [Sporomusa carbonis]|uniref:ABC transporter substrate-binding protein n=1 Tax=Sporomusa carbonis TaxID=3076075 RepID=UPI003A62E328
MSTAGKSQHSVVIGLLLIIAVLAAGCASQQPYKIGFAAGLTGRQSDIGVAGRNGVILAVEEINKAGGIKGRQAELIVKDDKNAPDFIQTVDAELISAGATVIIGHMTSAAAVAALPVADSGQVLIISPTARAEELAGRDDLMITVIPALSWIIGLSLL